MSICKKAIVLCNYIDMQLLKALGLGLEILKKQEKKKADEAQKTEAHAARFAEYLRLVEDPLNYGVLDSMVNSARKGVKIIVRHKDGHIFEILPVDQFDAERMRRPVQARPDF